ncbi:MAG TPA: rod shape-determining protein MreD [Terriglobia bacterium]|jgi:rod shape-determining protein MreD|nr:rod shape-determining protein MreD [Terriglobia bacterium]
MGNLWRSTAVLIIIVSTVVLQVLLTRYFPRLLLDLPLVSVLYLTIAKENLLWTIGSGTVVGFLQDSLSPGPLGLNGFTKISVGCLAYMANTFLAIDRVTTRWGMLFISSLLAGVLFPVLRILFLNRNEMFDGERILLSGLINASVGLPLFYIFDKISQSQNE